VCAADRRQGEGINVVETPSTGRLRMPLLRANPGQLSDARQFSESRFEQVDKRFDRLEDRMEEGF
jgi:hypothetical protein